MRKLWFGDIQLFSASYLKKLKELAGITDIIPDNYRIHLPGCRVSEEILDRSPFPRGWTQWPVSKRDIEAGGDMEITCPVFAGVAIQTDDAPLLQLLEACDKVGVQVCAHAGLWGYSGNIFPEMGFVDVFGKTIDEKMSPWAIPLCPNEETVIAFEAESIADVINRYHLPALNIDHGHFPPLANPHGLLGCACPRCRGRAGELGYDFDAMTEAVKDFFIRLKQLTALQLETVYAKACSYSDALSLLGAAKELFQWLEYRSVVVSGHVHSVSQRIIKALGRAAPIDSHVMPPSMAYLSGQDIGRWAKSVEYVSAGWGSVVGWDAAQIHSFIALAQLLAKTACVEEEFALKLLYRLFGYEDIAMPLSVASLRAHAFDSFEIYKRETALAIAAMPEGGKILLPFDATRNMRSRMDEMADWIRSLVPAGIVCFNWGNENTDEELLSIGKCR